MKKAGTATTRSGDLLIYVLVAALLGHVWRLQDLFGILAKLKFVAIVSLAALSLYIIDSDPRRSLGRIKGPILKYVLAIFVLMIISVPGSVYPGLSFNFVLQDHSKTLLLLLLLAGAVRTLHDVDLLLWGQVLGVAIYSTYVLAFVDVGMSGRLGDLAYYDANDLGMLIVCTIPVVIYFVKNGNGWVQRLLALGLLPLLLKTIIKTGSRGAFLGFAAVLFFMVFTFRAFPRRVRYGTAAALIALMVFTAGETYWESMRTLLDPQQDYNWSGNADEGRMEIWKRGIGYMLRYPVGVGANAFPVAEGMISPLAGRQDYGIGLKWSAAHNSFVQIGAELGGLGLILFVVLLATLFKFCWRLDRTKAMAYRSETGLGQVLCASLVGYLVVGFFLSQAYAPFLYSTIGIVLGIAKVVRQDGAARPVGSSAPRPIRYGRRRGRPVPALRGRR